MHFSMSSLGECPRMVKSQYLCSPFQRLNGEIDRLCSDKEGLERQLEEQSFSTSCSAHSEQEWNSLQHRLKVRIRRYRQKHRNCGVIINIMICIQMSWRLLGWKVALKQMDDPCMELSDIILPCEL